MTGEGNDWAGLLLSELVNLNIPKSCIAHQRSQLQDITSLPSPAFYCTTKVSEPTVTSTIGAASAAATAFAAMVPGWSKARMTPRRPV